MVETRANSGISVQNNKVVGRSVFDIESSKALPELVREWAQILPEQEGLLSKDLSITELVDLVSMSRARFGVAKVFELVDYQKRWNLLRNSALIKAIGMRSKGNPFIKIARVFDTTQKPEYQERLVFGFKLEEGATYRTSVAISNFGLWGETTRDDILRMVGNFDENVVFGIEEDHSKRLSLREEVYRLQGTEEERIDALLKRDFTPEEIAGILFKINNEMGFLNTHLSEKTIQFAARTKHRFLMRAAVLGTNGTEGIGASLGKAKDGKGEEITFSFDRKGKLPYKTRVKTSDLEKDFPDYLELCEPILGLQNPR